MGITPQDLERPVGHPLSITGTKFDSSFDRQRPFSFKLGVGEVIPGWDQGLVGVCKGEERHLVVPAALAYGEMGAGDVIPPGGEGKRRGPAADGCFNEIIFRRLNSPL